MVCVGTFALTYHLSIYLSTTSFGMFQFFQNQTTGTFTHDKSVATGGGRAGSGVRIVISGKPCGHGIKAAHTATADSRLRSTAYNDIRFTQADQIESISNSVARRSTCRCFGIVRSMESIMDGYLTCCYISNHLRNKERIKLRTVCLMLTIIFDFFLESTDTSDSDTVYYADAVFVLRFQINATVFYTLHSGYHSQLGVTIHFAGFLTVNEIIHVQVFYLASKLCFEIGCIKLCNRCCSANPGNHVLPCFLRIIANWSHCSKTCYNYSF